MPGPVIAYDASQQSLLHPGLRPTLLGHEIPDVSNLEALCAECSRLAYLRFEDSASPQEREALSAALGAVGISGLACFSDDATSTEAFAAVLPNGAGTLVSFRGTDPEDVANIATDLNAILEPWEGGGRVHAGFALAFSRIRAPMEAWLQSQATADGALVVTGHSLGAALATLAAAAWRPGRLINFGSPRVGDDAFVALLRPDAISRYVDCCDIITQLPPAISGLFADTSPAIYITATGAVEPDWTEDQIAKDRATARDRYLVEQAWVRGNVITRDLADHTPINYVRALVG